MIPVDVSSDNTGVEVVQAADTDSLFYYLVVLGAWDDINSYTLTVSVEQEPGCFADRAEPNNDIDLAWFLDPEEHRDFNICLLDEDWYAFWADEGQQMRVFIEFFHFRGDLDLYLYDPDWPAWMDDPVWENPPCDELPCPCGREGQRSCPCGDPGEPRCPARSRSNSDNEEIEDREVITSGFHYFRVVGQDVETDNEYEILVELDP